MKSKKLCFGDLPLCLCGPRKNYALLAPNMYIHKLPYDHGFAQKQPKSVFDASIKFYYHKRDAMAIFCVSSAILRYFAYWEL